METESWRKAMPEALKRALLPRGPSQGAVPLRELRAVVLGSGIALVVILAVLLVIPLGDPDRSAVTWLILGGAGAASLYGCVVLRAKASRGVVAADSGDTAERAYTARLYQGAASAMAAALTGFAITFIREDLLAYWIGWPVSAALLAWVAPRKRDIDHLQERIRAAGGSVDLWKALTTPRS